MKQVVRYHGHHDVQLKIAALVADCHRYVVANHLSTDHHHRFADDRIDLARHDAGTGLESGHYDLTQASHRAAIHPAQVVGDFHQRRSRCLELATELRYRIQRRLRCKVIPGLDKGQTGTRGQHIGYTPPKIGMGIHTRADGRST